MTFQTVSASQNYEVMQCTNCEGEGMIKTSIGETYCPECYGVGEVLTSKGRLRKFLDTFDIPKRYSKGW